MQKRQRFTAEFKREAVWLLKAGDRPAALSAWELGIPCNRLYNWATDLDAKGADAFGGSGRPKANQDERPICSARKSGCAKRTRLKKAAAYFARELP